MRERESSDGFTIGYLGLFCRGGEGVPPFYLCTEYSALFSCTKDPPNRTTLICSTACVNRV